LSRLIVIDEDLNKRRATELRNRGRNAVHVVASFGRGLKDPELFQRLVERTEDCVLVTADDSMPADHGPLMKQMGITVAIVGLGRPSGYLPDAWEAELIHRWAHRIEVQAKGTVLRYSARSATVWRPRKRPRSAIALESA
jgi:hypothetical protein